MKDLSFTVLIFTVAVARFLQEFVVFFPLLKKELIYPRISKNIFPKEKMSIGYLNFSKFQMKK